MRSIVVPSLLLAFAAGGCVFPELSRDGLACNEQHPCADGYSCVEGMCVLPEGATCDEAIVGTVCSTGVGECRFEGTYGCSSQNTLVCSAQAGAGTDEVCDGKDNDCDSSTDEELLPPPCELGKGVCAGAQRSCGGASGWSSCSYGTDYEVNESRCDGKDNDCDGTVDEVSNCKSLTTIAGDGPPGFRDGDAPTARFAAMKGMTLDADGNVYVADYHNHAIRKIDTQGVVSTIAGNSLCGETDGPAATSQLCYPWDLELDSEGTLYFSDSGNDKLRAISAGVVSTVAGSGDGSAVGDARTQARFSQLAGIKVLANGDVLLADRGNHVIRR